MRYYSPVGKGVALLKAQGSISYVQSDEETYEMAGFITLQLANEEVDRLRAENKACTSRLHELAVHIQKLEEDIGWAVKEREIEKLKNLLGACRCHIDNPSFDEEGDLTRDVDEALGLEEEPT